MYCIGLTGNIATGKSVVRRHLCQKGAHGIDADGLAHQVMAVGTPAWEEIRGRFGDGVLMPDGSVDRVALGDIVLADPQALADLEEIVHPRVVEEVERRLDQIDACDVGEGACSQSTRRVAVVEAIKLLEAGLGERCQAVWVTVSAPRWQLRRLMERRGLDREAAKRRIASQPPPEKRAKRADVLLENDGSLEQLLALVDWEWEQVQAGRAPGMVAEVAGPELVRGHWQVVESGCTAVAESEGPATWRLHVSCETRVARLGRVLLPVLEQQARRDGADRLTLRVPARTGYRQFLRGLGYTEEGDGGRAAGTSSFERGL